VVAKPTAGVVVFVNKVSQGIYEGWLQDNKAEWNRYPRYFGEGGLLLVRTSD
jgi:hypothetical protein